jgi:hypothetical protein
MADDIDITADLIDGSDGALGDAAPINAGTANTEQVAPDGTVGLHERTDPAVRANEVEPAKPASIRDQLSNAFKGTEEAKPAEAAAAQAAPALVKDAEGKYRNNDGTFASAEQVAAFEAAQNAAPVVEQQAPAAYEQGMTPLELQQFKSLPAELQQFVARTMEDLNVRQTRYGEYDLIEQSLLGPRREAWAQNGMTPAVALNQLLAMSDFATRDPGAFVLWYANEQGLDLDVLLDEADKKAQANPVDPVLASLQAKVDQIAQHVTGAAQQQQGTVQQERLTLVQRFADEKDGAGQPKRPYLSEVMPEWGTQIAAVRHANPQMTDADVLQKAYDNACSINPAVRAKIQQATLKAQQDADAARVAAAKAAGSSVTGQAPNGGGTPSAALNPNMGLRDQLKAQFDAARV